MPRVLFDCSQGMEYESRHRVPLAVIDYDTGVLDTEGCAVKRQAVVGIIRVVRNGVA